jgi:hypothetical protein
MVPQLYCTKIIFIINFLKFRMIRKTNSFNIRSEIIQHLQLIQDPLIYTVNIYVLNITIFLEGLFTLQTFRRHITKTLDINKLMLSALKKLKISINLLTYYSTYFNIPISSHLIFKFCISIINQTK